MSDCGETHCVTCSDEGIDMTVVALTQCGAQCRDRSGVDHRVEIDLVEPVALGDPQLVHAGGAHAQPAPTPQPP